jgi:hypothetical protein
LKLWIKDINAISPTMSVLHRKATENQGKFRISVAVHFLIIGRIAQPTRRCRSYPQTYPHFPWTTFVGVYTPMAAWQIRGTGFSREGGGSIATFALDVPASSRLKPVPQDIRLAER